MQQVNAKSKAQQSMNNKQHKQISAKELTPLPVKLSWQKMSNMFHVTVQYIY